MAGAPPGLGCIYMPWHDVLQSWPPSCPRGRAPDGPPDGAEALRTGPLACSASDAQPRPPLSGSRLSATSSAPRPSPQPGMLSVLLRQACVRCPCSPTFSTSRLSAPGWPARPLRWSSWRPVAEPRMTSETATGLPAGLEGRAAAATTAASLLSPCLYPCPLLAAPGSRASLPALPHQRRAGLHSGGCIAALPANRAAPESGGQGSQPGAAQSGGSGRVGAARPPPSAMGGIGGATLASRLRLAASSAACLSVSGTGLGDSCGNELGRSRGCESPGGLWARRDWSEAGSRRIGRLGTGN
jgi:hypothetical protein